MKKVENTEVMIPAIDFRYATIKVVGDSPLIMHKWSEKAKKEILDKQMKKAKTAGREAKNPVADFINSAYWLDGEPEEKTEEGFAKAIANGARFGFPAGAFKDAAVSAGYRTGITKDKATMKGAFHVIGEFAEIDGIPTMREDMVRVGMGTADIRYRCQFEKWSTLLHVKYNASVISLEQLVSLLNLGGFVCGVGEWRAEKSGSFGLFHIE